MVVTDESLAWVLNPVRLLPFSPSSRPVRGGVLITLRSGKARDFGEQENTRTDLWAFTSRRGEGDFDYEWLGMESW